MNFLGKADKSQAESVRRVKNVHRTREEVETRRPLAHENRARMTDDERQEQRRKGQKPLKRRIQSLALKAPV